MKRRVTILLGCLALVLLGAGADYLLRLPFAAGVGKYRESPDHKWRANATSFDEQRRLGGKRSYYEFTIEIARPEQADIYRQQSVRRVVMEAPTEPAVNWREEGDIQWAADSSAETFRYKGTRMTVEMTLKVAP